MIFILCPAYVTTGGPELLHQLGAELRSQGFQAVMYYLDIEENSKESPQPLIYQKYNVPYCNGLIDEKEHIVIIPEVGINLLPSIKKAKVFYWWLSVDLLYNALHSNINKFKDYTYEYKISLLLGNFYRYNVYHLVQSYYAMDHCRKLNIPNQKIFYLSDYLRNDFLQNIDISQQMQKENIVLYNPKKGMDFLNKIMAHGKHICWVPLINLSVEEMSALLMSAKVYVDFGIHPGMERIPREAAISGCCVITGMKGSAGCEKDVPIPAEYKFYDMDENISEIIQKIEDIFTSYPNHYNKFAFYREFIISQKEKFSADVTNIFSRFIRK